MNLGCRPLTEKTKEEEMFGTGFTIGVVPKHNEYATIYIWGICNNSKYW